MGGWRRHASQVAGLPSSPHLLAPSLRRVLECGGRPPPSAGQRQPRSSSNLGRQDSRSALRAWFEDRADMYMGAIICFNVVFVYAELERSGAQAGVRLGATSGGVWPDVDAAFSVIANVFAVTFLIELSCKVWGCPRGSDLGASWRRRGAGHFLIRAEADEGEIRSALALRDLVIFVDSGCDGIHALPAGPMCVHTEGLPPLNSASSANLRALHRNLGRVLQETLRLSERTLYPLLVPFSASIGLWLRHFAPDRRSTHCGGSRFPPGTCISADPAVCECWLKLSRRPAA